MGFKGYRAFRDNYIDNGLEVSVVLTSDYRPDFQNRHTMQIWDAGSQTSINVDKWVGTTLIDRSLHDIYIVNNSNVDTFLTFSRDYLLIDEENFNTQGLQTVTIKPNGTAHFYCTAVLRGNNLRFEMRTGSQDDKKD